MSATELIWVLPTNSCTDDEAWYNPWREWWLTSLKLYTPFLSPQPHNMNLPFSVVGLPCFTSTCF